MNEVTDPKLLEQLNSPDTPFDKPSTEVTDPDLLAKLNETAPYRDASGALMAGKKAPSATVDDMLKSLLTGAGRGIAETPGGINDLSYYAQMGLGKLSGMLGGPNDWDQEAKDALAAPHFGVASTDKFLDDAGLLDYKSKTGAGQAAANVGNFAGSAATSGIPGALRKGLPAALKAIATESGLGVGGGIGNELGKAAADKLNVGDDSPWTKALLELGGALAGSRSAGGAMNRSALFEKPPISKDFEAAGVTPSMPSDINGGGGFLSTSLPTMFGAKGTMKSSAADTQTELKNATEQGLNGIPNSTQDIGNYVHESVATKLNELGQEVEDAYSKLAKTMSGTDVHMGNTHNAIIDVTDGVQTPAIADVLRKNPALERYGALVSGEGVLSAPWQDVDALRRDVGRQIGSTQNASERGLLKQIYKAVTEDIFNAANVEGDGQAIMSDASTKSKALQKLQDATFDPVLGKSPENIPAWLMSESKRGDTRLATLFDSLNPADAQDYGRFLLHDLGYNPSNQWDMGTYMKAWKALAPEAQEALTRDPATKQLTARAERLWDATENSRRIASTPTADGISGLLDQSKLGTALGAAAGALGNMGSDVVHSMAGGAGVGAVAAPIALGVGANMAARAATTPSLINRFAAPVAGDMLRRTPQIMSGARGAAIQDFYTPPPPVAAPPSGKTSSEWLGDPSVDVQQKAAFIGSRLGPQVAQSMNTGSPESNNAAIALVMMNPEYRKQLE